MLYNSRTGTCKILHTVFLWMDEQSVGLFGRSNTYGCFNSRILVAALMPLPVDVQKIPEPDKTHAGRFCSRISVNCQV